MSERTVKVESTVDYAVVLSEPYNRFERNFHKDGQRALIDFNIMEEGLQLPGFRGMFTDGILRIIDKKDRVDLGLEAADGEEEYNEIEKIETISTSEAIKLFKSRDYKAIENKISKVSSSTVENLINVAIKFKLTDSTLIDILQKYSPNSTEIVDLIKLAKDAEKDIDIDEQN